MIVREVNPGLEVTTDGDIGCQCSPLPRYRHANGMAPLSLGSQVYDYRTSGRGLTTNASMRRMTAIDVPYERCLVSVHTGLTEYVR
jgi:hypothetical protein